ncbi:cytochrome P450 [Ramlibacter henchirensis]|uniref:Cytochrome P450 n=1 Tax=Ramlibacter henchirensis TaxID=204072 RepID=A0A4Z0C6T1_9BURK|nr:cytochrome P450 [Ramlibacter henchirensis]TFZ06088.1 cytochrome P450 [Ramlibacter henchirensis]
MDSTTTSDTVATRAMDALPGPRPWPLVGNALQIQRERFHLQLEEWARQYGSPFTFSIRERRFMVVTQADSIGQVLRRRPDLFRRTERIEKVSAQMGFLGLFTASGDTWRRQRPMVLAGLDPAHIRQFFPALVKVTDRLRRRWEKAAREGAVIDLQADLMRYTVDVTTGLAFGEDLNTLESAGDATIQQHLNVVMPALFKRLLSPMDPPAWLRRMRDREMEPHLRALRTAVHDFIAKARAALQARPELREQPQNLIQALVAARDRPGSGVTDEDVAGNVLTMLLAGEDTTANTLAWMLWHLHRHPEAAAAAREEVDRVLGGANGVHSLEQLAKLDVVEACASETMRLKPVAPFIMNQALGDTVVEGVSVRKGQMVICLMRPPGLQEQEFPQPERFDPLRWRAEGAAAHAMASAKRHTMPFGAGPRMCPGRYLALAEIKLAAAMVLANFELEEVAPEGGGEPRERIAIVMAPVGLKMRLRPRGPRAGLNPATPTSPAAGA